MIADTVDSTGFSMMMNSGGLFNHLNLGIGFRLKKCEGKLVVIKLLVELSQNLMWLICLI